MEHRQFKAFASAVLTLHENRAGLTPAAVGGDAHQVNVLPFLPPLPESKGSGRALLCPELSSGITAETSQPLLLGINEALQINLFQACLRNTKSSRAVKA